MPNPKLNVSEAIECFPGKIERKPGFPVFNLFSPFDVALRENQLRFVQSELDLDDLRNGGLLQFRAVAKSAGATRRQQPDVITSSPLNQFGFCLASHIPSRTGKAGSPI